MLAAAQIDEIASRIINTAHAIHRELGPGVFESAYSRILAAELEAQGSVVQRELSVPCIFKGRSYGEAFRLDLLVENEIIVEVKSLPALDPVFFKQVLTYLRLTGKRLGLLLNFGEPTLVIKRIANGL